MCESERGNERQSKILERQSAILLSREIEIRGLTEDQRAQQRWQVHKGVTRRTQSSFNDTIGLF